MNNITFVTAYFKFNQNKYNSNYFDWMSNLLLNLDNNIIIFTDKISKSVIEKLRDNYKDKTIIIEMKLEEFHSIKYLDYFIKDHLRDKYRHIRNPNLYMIWNEKLKFVEKSIDINPFKTLYFAWIDIGYIRNPIYINRYLKNGFPNLNKLKEDKIYMLNIDYNFTEEDFKDPFNKKYQMIDNKIGGGFIIGNSINLKKMIDEFYNIIIPEYIKRDYFLGEDQTLYTSLYLKRPDLITIIRGDNDDTTIPYCEFKWFYFLKFLT
jgi:hypothetical protein